MLEIVKSSEFLRDVVECDYKEAGQAPESVRHAFHFMISLFSRGIGSGKSFLVTRRGLMAPNVAISSRSLKTNALNSPSSAIWRIRRSTTS